MCYSSGARHYVMPAVPVSCALPTQRVGELTVRGQLLAGGGLGARGRQVDLEVGLRQVLGARESEHAGVDGGKHHAVMRACVAWVTAGCRHSQGMHAHQLHADPCACWVRWRLRRHHRPPLQPLSASAQISLTPGVWPVA